MFLKKDIVKDSRNKESIRILTETAETISAYGKEIQETAENIMMSCQIMPGTKGEAHKDLLLHKADNMVKLAGLYNSASKRYMNAVEKLADGVPEEKVLSEVFAYTTFFNDQLECEEEDANQILSILHENCQDIYNGGI